MPQPLPQQEHSRKLLPLRLPVLRGRAGLIVQRKGLKAKLAQQAQMAKHQPKQVLMLPNPPRCQKQAAGAMMTLPLVILRLLRPRRQHQHAR
ncbi:hypothetical protein AA0481_1853 [Acetobacter orientalis NRIC 0481]|nr:hypothetical protein AA0481_1853 [Acetobacter orientalis NRIC 0481]